MEPLQHLALNQVPRLSIVKFCWICFGTEDDDPAATWVSPCRCKGSTKWVHQLCIQRWVDEMLLGSWTDEVNCPNCNTVYSIEVPDASAIIKVLDQMDHILLRVCPFLAAGAMMSSLYLTAFVYGGITVLQVVGFTSGLEIMERCAPLELLVGLPAIPVSLVLMKLVNWEDYITSFLRQRVAVSPVLGCFLPIFRPPSSVAGPPQPDVAQAQLPSHISTASLLCSALTLPTFATICGNIMFDSVPSNVQRTLLGGLVYVAAKGFMRVYQKQQNYLRQAGRRVLDYTAVQNEAV